MKRARAAELDSSKPPSHRNIDMNNSKSSQSSQISANNSDAGSVATIARGKRPIILLPPDVESAVLNIANGEQRAAVAFISCIVYIRYMLVGFS